MLAHTALPGDLARASVTCSVIGWSSEGDLQMPFAALRRLSPASAVRERKTRTSIGRGNRATAARARQLEESTRVDRATAALAREPARTVDERPDVSAELRMEGSRLGSKHPSERADQATQLMRNPSN
jgi:hypothetical protein